MIFKTLLPYFSFAFLFSLLLAGCQYDPHANLLTTIEPSAEDIIGTYVLDRYDLPESISFRDVDIEVELHNDGTFTAINVPSWKVGEPDKDFTSTLQSGQGKWEKSILGTLDPGSKHIWGIYLRNEDNQFLPADFTGDQPPYGLIFTIGDPDSGNAIILKKIR